MKIEIWSDFVCPFCYIGKRKLERALDDFPHKENVKVEFKSFQLDPNASPYDGQNYHESLAAKFGSVEQAKQVTKNVAEQAKGVGLDFRFDMMKPTNSFKAHRLTHFAKQHGQANHLTERLMHAHFTAGKDIHDHDTLLAIATSAGLAENDVEKVLSEKSAYQDEVNADIQEAKQHQITGVPFFVFNRKYAISGAQPLELFKDTLEKTWAEEN